MPVPWRQSAPGNHTEGYCHEHHTPLPAGRSTRAVPGHPGAYFGNYSHTALLHHPFRLHAARCAFEYELCKRVRQPIYHEITQTVGSTYRSYVRLLLPTVDSLGKVQKLYYATRYLTEPIAV